MTEDNVNKLEDIDIIDSKIEVIFVNDKVDDEIIINEKIYKYQIKLINNKKKQGIHKSRVIGLSNAIGKYILFLDQDDYISPNFLKSQISKVSDYDVIVSNGFFGNDNKGFKEIYSKNELNKICDLKFYKAYNRIISPGQSLILRESIPSFWKENILKINGSDDYFLWVLMLFCGKKFTINRDKIYIHYESNENTSNNVKMMADSSKEVVNKLEKYDSSFVKFLFFFKRYNSAHIGSAFSIFKNVVNLFLYPDIFFIKIKIKICCITKRKLSVSWWKESL